MSTLKQSYQRRQGIFWWSYVRLDCRRLWGRWVVVDAKNGVLLNRPLLHIPLLLTNNHTFSWLKFKHKVILYLFKAKNLICSRNCSSPCIFYVCVWWCVWHLNLIYCTRTPLHPLRRFRLFLGQCSIRVPLKLSRTPHTT